MNIEDDILIERFLRKELSKIEEEGFIIRTKKDSNFREQFLLEKQLWQTLNDTNWSFAKNIDHANVQKYEGLFKSAEAQKIKDSIFTAKKNYKNSKSRKRIWYSSIASVLLIFSILMYTSSNEKTPKELYTFHINQVSLPSFVNRNNNDQYKNLLKAQALFESKEYQKSITLFIEELNKANSPLRIYLYLSIAQIEINKFRAAENTLNNLIKSDYIDREKGYWYKSLLYLKTEDLVSCKNILQVIIDNSYYNHVKAKELLDKISDL